MLMYSFFLASFLPWQAWGPCSRTCNYGVRQRIRQCSGGEGACQGLGLDVEMEYCSEPDCPGIAVGAGKSNDRNVLFCASPYISGALMAPAFVSQAALEEFESDGVALVIPNR